MKKKLLEKKKIAGINPRSLKSVFTLDRPFSWSALSSFKYNPEDFFNKYILGIKTETTAAIEFGKFLGETLANDLTFLPEVPRYSVFEQKLTGRVDHIPLIGYLDSFDPKTKAFYEYKSSSNPKKWTQKSVQEHGQLLFYKFLIWTNYGVRPEDVDCHLIYIPCKESGDFSVKLTGEKPVIYEARHTTVDLLHFAQSIKDTYKEMETYVKNHA